MRTPPIASERSGDAATGEPSEPPASTGRLLAVWVLLGFSLAGLGWDLVDATAVTATVSPVWAGVLFGTAAVVGLRTAGIRPSVPACFAYFATQLVLHFLLVLVFILLTSGSLEPLWDAGIRVVSVVPAATLWLTGTGRAGRRRVRQRTRRFLGSSANDENGYERP